MPGAINHVDGGTNHHSPGVQAGGTYAGIKTIPKTRWSRDAAVRHALRRSRRVHP